MRVSRWVALGAVLAIVSVAGVAVAATVRHTSKVTITKTSPVFAGKVKSSEPACIAGRKVVLHAVEPHEVVGTDKTNSQGKWKIAFQGQGVVHYFAKVRRHEDGTAGTLHVCRADRSKTIQAP